MHKYVFTDTNLFEQFQPITDIDWLRLADCESLTLLVPTVTIRELNEHKDSATRGRLKRKAAAALVDLKRYKSCGTPVRIRDGVDLDFRPREPLINFASYHLDPSLSDDRLLATAIEFVLEEKVPPKSVMVATGDFGLQLKIASHSLVTPLSLPDNLRLPDELDVDEKRIRELESEIKVIKSTRPLLSLAFKDGTRIEKHTAVKPDLTEASIQNVLQEVRKEHPLRVPSPRKGTSVFDLAYPAETMAQQYNAHLEQYYSDMELYLRASGKILEWWAATIELELVLSNQDGTCPADDIDVQLTFGSDVIPVKEHKLPKPPARPAPPGASGPMAGLAALLSGEDRLARFTVQDFARPLNDLPNVSIHDVRNGFVNFHVRRLKHLTEAFLSKVYLHFESGLRNISLDHQIIAGNMPEAVTGTLAIVIE